jgi:hypothetical protein
MKKHNFAGMAVFVLGWIALGIVSYNCGPDKSEGDIVALWLVITLAMVIPAAYVREWVMNGKMP